MIPTDVLDGSLLNHVVREIMLWFKNGTTKILRKSASTIYTCDNCPCEDSPVYQSGTTSSSVSQRKLAGSNLNVLQEYNFAGQTLAGIRAVDDLGNYYVVDATTTTDPTVRKYASDGTLDWTFSDVDLDVVAWIDVDLNYNVYVFGGDFSGVDVTIYKLNSSGVEQWSDKVSGSNPTATCCAVDVTGNVAICGSYTSGSDVGQLLRYYDNTGSVQWNKDDTSPGSGDVDLNRHVLFDSSGNLYVCRSHTGGTGTEADIEKYNDAGTSQWTKNPGDALSVGMDSDENLVVLFIDSGTVKIRRYSGASHSTTDWTVNSSNGSATADIAVTSTGRIYSGGGDACYRYDPTDGSQIASVSYSSTQTHAICAYPGRYPNF